MTEKQYEEYKELNDEVEKLKFFLFYCGKKYRYDKFVKNFVFNILRIKGFDKRFKLNISNAPLWGDDDRTFEISKDLQDRIIDVIEEYVDEKEEEMRKI